jgi:hypothetical protein
VVIEARDRVLRRRLATQRLTSAPLPRAAEVVRLLAAVQSQERDHALYSLALRTKAGTYGRVRAELDGGGFVRTHVLRPTWHFVAPEDLRWMLALTSPRVVRSMAARDRQLGLDDVRLLARSFEAIASLLEGRNFLTRKEIGQRLSGRRGVAQQGEQLGHVLLTAELRALICSGPTKGGQHSYALVDEVVPPARERDRAEAVVELLHRFLRGHGPAEVRDFTRWSSLTVADAEAGLAELAGVLDHVEVEGRRLWFDPAVSARTTAPRRAYLLPMYDEVALTYPRLGFPPLPGHPHERAGNPWQQDAFVGGVVHDERLVGTWKRTVTGDTVRVRTHLAPGADAGLVRAAAQRLADVYERRLEYVTTAP